MKMYVFYLHTNRSENIFEFFNHELCFIMNFRCSYRQKIHVNSASLPIPWYLSFKLQILLLADFLNF